VFVVQRSTGRVPSHLHTPDTLEGAAELLTEHAGRVRLSAGCTYLMLMAAHGEVLPPHLVSLHRVPALQQVGPREVGSSVTLRALERGPRTGPERALTMAASFTAGPAVRSLGTLGGNLGFADGDLHPALMALDATVHLDDGSTRPVADHVTEPDLARIATRVSWTRDGQQGWTGASVKLARRSMDWPVVTVACALQLAPDGTITAATTAAQALAATPVHLPGVDAVLVGSQGEAEALDYASHAAVERIEIRSDEEATAAYRKRVTPAVVRRALEIALAAGPDGDVELREARR
jgi:aerobic carbon-monoxide dehydrogenase medium subunit